MAELKITAANFEKEVLQSEIPVVIDFWATWCGPCRMLAPIVAKIAEKYDGKIKVGKVDVDEESTLAAKFGVASIPFVVKMEGGKVTATSVGYMPQASLEAALGLE
ncbi:MAG: thioredoxin [Clostridia bacterium]|nr:thioredoxin [Clostridia bacterium]MBR4186586.1 thioredoxin [Clostridia bacterium]